MDADEAELRRMYDGLLAAWADNSAEDYASFFAPDAQYVIATGDIENGHREIVAGHREIFETWAKGTTLAGQLLGIRELAPGVRLLTASGGVIEVGATASTELNVYTIIAVRGAGGWQFAAYQITPVVAYG
ncbi:MAG TPA: SgcJ/EcaC family oxidoreductase [Streptosporangiaceae bacterium]|jgi:uncharacterized protein (TIGR02246 family)